jgi:hypothetical protein
METTRGAPAAKRAIPYIVAIVIGGGGIAYALYEHNNAQSLTEQNQLVSAQLSATHSQLDALAAKVNSLAASTEARPTRSASAGAVTRRPRAGAHRAGAQDARFKKLQSQLDAQGKAIDDTRNDLASARNDLTSTRTELTGSIARTHDELVVLEKKGERSYFEFDIQKSKQFKHEGPLGISLRKANEKRQYADLQLMVDDRTLTQKHVNLYQPAMFYKPDSQRPIEIVINQITKDRIHGYVSAPKYRQSELTMASNTGANSQSGADPAANPQPPARQRLPVPEPDQQ